ncbi:transcriptional regulator [Salinilacihabitans rarus]|uniref:transcriptional regulator n=1 Tax=Salinilacihabitans rarus TaxID=2961596 RepID=UPI0020C9217F|nr:winged helix-turn-helix domain-containing protein [Salinilacihabitans rarus]
MTYDYSRLVSDEEFVDTVADLYAAGERLPGDGGVPIDAVADTLGVSKDTASRHLKRLADAGEVDRVLGLGPKGPQPSYAPVEVDDAG